MNWTNLLSLSSLLVQAFATQRAFTFGAPPSEVKERSESSWNCTIRGWVRAPDLTPSSIIPAEVRFAANGSSCNDISSLAVGLRFKERAIVKLKKPSNTEFPVKPTRKPRNMTSRNPTDYNDIFRAQSRVYFDNEDEEYRKAWEIYNEAIANRNLWDVEGVERKVFDTGLNLTIDDSSSMENLDEIKKFWIHMPSTNFPPIEDSSWGNRILLDNDERLLNGESIMEYYLNVTLGNGTILDIPAARSGFKPQTESLPERSWPITKKIEFPRINVTEDENDEMGFKIWRPKAPECDKDAFANFTISVAPTPSVISPGDKVVLDVNLRREGNGTEYPSVLNTFLRTDKVLDWAVDRLGSREAYDEIIHGKSTRGALFHGHGDFMTTGMLSTKPMELLQKERKRREESGGGGTYSYGMNRGPLSSGQGRYDFDKLEKEAKDEYRFKIEFNVPYNALPTFNGTFFSFHTRIRFNIHTVFLCLQEDSKDEKELSATEIRDKEWVEAHLPPRNKNSWARIDHSGLTHSINVDIDMVLPSSTKDQTPIHYTDESAEGPILSLTDSGTQTFPSLDHERRKETRAELRRSRYNDDNYDYLICGDTRCNTGGGMMHAAKMWQEKEILEQVPGEREMEVEDAEIEKGSEKADDDFWMDW